MLTPKERINKVFKGEVVDRPPCICPGGMMNMITKDLIEKVNVDFRLAHNNPKVMADIAKKVYTEGCFENYGVPFCMTVEAEGFGATVNMGSSIYEPHVKEYIIESVSEWGKIPKIDLEDGRTKTVVDAIKILKDSNDDVPIIANITGPISTASSIIEPVTFYKELRKRNKEAHEFVNFVTEQLIAIAERQIEAGADIITISDPSGTGEILGKKYFEEFAVRYINKLVESIQKHNIKTIVHICGQMKNVYDEVNKIKSDVLSFDSIVPMKDARKNLGDRLLMGNVSTYTIEFADEEKIKILTEKCVEDGSNIVSPACGLGMKSPLKNVKAMLKTLQKETV